jgi:hypothetical protein
MGMKFSESLGDYQDQTCQDGDHMAPDLHGPYNPSQNDQEIHINSTRAPLASPVSEGTNFF